MQLYICPPDARNRRVLHPRTLVLALLLTHEHVPLLTRLCMLTTRIWVFVRLIVRRVIARLNNLVFIIIKLGHPMELACVLVTFCAFPNMKSSNMTPGPLLHHCYGYDGICWSC